MHHRKNEKKVSDNKEHSEHVPCWPDVPFHSFHSFPCLPACLPVCCPHCESQPTRPLSRSGIASALLLQRPLPWVKTSRKKKNAVATGVHVYSTLSSCWLFPAPAPALCPSLSVVASVLPFVQQLLPPSLHQLLSKPSSSSSSQSFVTLIMPRET